jgi:Cu/Ag efflux pump CusA
MSRHTGVAGQLAGAFVHSKLTPLFIVASMLLGVYAVIALPREEEPQIIVPMIDVFVEMPGASPAEVEQRVTRPGGRVSVLDVDAGARNGRRPLPRRPG